MGGHAQAEVKTSPPGVSAGPGEGPGPTQSGVQPRLSMLGFEMRRRGQAPGPSDRVALSATAGTANTPLLSSTPGASEDRL
jgi:hypothetical protein